MTLSIPIHACSAMVRRWAWVVRRSTLSMMNKQFVIWITGAFLLSLCAGALLHTIFAATATTSSNVLGWFLIPLFWLTYHSWLPALFFSFLYLVVRCTRKGLRLSRGFILFAAITWTACALYEWHMQAWEETVVASIRLDLVLFSPFLLLVSLLALLGFWNASRAPVIQSTPSA